MGVRPALSTRRPRGCAATAVAALVLLFALVLVPASPALADAYQSMANQRNTLPGGRAAFMGGAFTAVADDSSATYYNPAGLAFLGTTDVDASATAYRTSILRYQEAVNDEPFTERSSTIYPSYLGGTTRFGSLALGYSFLTLDAHNIYQQDKYDEIAEGDGAPNTYSRTYQESSSYIMAGGSAAVRLGDRLSFGTSSFYYERTIEFSATELVQLNGGGVYNINHTQKTRNTGIANVTGLLWRSDSWSLGVAVHTAMALSNRSDLLTDTITFDPNDPDRNADGEAVPTVESTSTKAKPLNELNPTTYAAGLAWHPSRWFLISTDALIHEGVKSPYKSRGGFDLHTTANYSVGMDLTLGPAHVMSGAFSNNSMYRAPDPDVAGQPVHIDYIGYTGGLGWNMGSLEGSFGVVHQIGHGEAQIRTDDPTIQRVDGDITNFVFTGRFIFEATPAAKR